MRMKYVIFVYQNIYMPVIFPEHVTHAQVRVLPNAKPVSAGFCSFRNGLVVAFGESESLKLKADVSRDSELLRLSIIGSGTAAFLTSNFPPL